MTEVLREGSWLRWLSLREVSRGGSGAAEGLSAEGVRGLKGSKGCTRGWTAGHCSRCGLASCKLQGQDTGLDEVGQSR